MFETQIRDYYRFKIRAIRSKIFRKQRCKMRNVRKHFDIHFMHRNAIAFIFVLNVLSFLAGDLLYLACFYRRQDEVQAWLGEWQWLIRILPVHICIVCLIQSFTYDKQSMF